MYLNQQFGQKVSAVLGLITLSALMSGFTPVANAATYYVATTGSDSYTVSETVDNVTKPYKTIGTVSETVDNVTKPYKTIGKALQRAKDNFATYGVNNIVVEPGVYAESISLNQSNMTLKARYDATATTTQRSILRPSGANIWNIVSVNASYVNVRGFEVDGTNAYVDGTTDTGTYGAATNGINIVGRHPNWDGSQIIPAALHVNISKCVVHNAGGGGIATQNSNSNPDSTHNTAWVGGVDYLTVEDNIVYNNCYWSRWQPSGISFYGCTNTNTGDNGYHNIIRRNRVYGNIAKFTGMSLDDPPRNYHTDGNGIILDISGLHNPPTLVENNIVYKNGGRGIHVFNVSNVMVRNNTTYKNNLDPDIISHGGGELSVLNAHYMTLSNNVSYGTGGTVPAIKVAAADYYLNAGGTMDNIAICSCTYWGAGSETLAGVIDWNSTFYGNPYFHNAEAGDFTVNIAPTLSGKTQAQSQFVIDRSSTTNGEFASDTVTGATRPATGKDRGAYERSLTSGGSL